MKREYHKWYSPSLGRDMELLIFGHGGTPLLVFPSSMGRFFEYEDRGMIATISGRYDRGQVQAFCPDSVDKESWYNKRVHPSERARRHQAYHAYIMNELVPLIRRCNPAQGITATGCSFGGYHAMDAALRHPDVFHSCIPMSGAFDIRQFVGGYYDQNVYFSNPVDYLPNTRDNWFLERYRRNRYILAVGDWDICRPDNERFDGIMSAKGIPHRLDLWGEQSKHDWPLWHRMAQAYFK